jgi:hypothetical protein
MIGPDDPTTLTFGTGAQRAIGFTPLDPADRTRCDSNQLAPGSNPPSPSPNVGFASSIVSRYSDAEQMSRLIPK